MKNQRYLTNPTHRVVTIALRKSLLGILLASFAISVFAQQPPVDAGALQQNLEYQLPSPSPLDLPKPGPKQQEIRAPKKGEASVTVTRFELLGIKLIAESDVQEVLQPFLNRPLSFDDLQIACDEIETLYRSRGYLVHATVPPQKVKDGVIVIMVTEAKLGKVLIDTPDGDTRFGIVRAASYITWAHPKGQELDLKAISRAIVILNETPGVSVTSSMEPGASDGETDLRLALRETPWYNATVEANNYGSKTTGTAQGVVQASLNNVTGIGDQVTANGIYSQGSSYTQASYNFPVLPNGLRGGFSGTYLNYKNIPGYQANGGYGDAWTLSASLAYPLARTEEGNANVSLRYDSKIYINFLNATDSVSSSYRINNAVLAFSGNRYDSFLGGAINNGQLSFVFGNLDLSSNNPSNYGVYTPSNFFKLAYSGNRSQTVIPDASKLLFNLSGQFANQNLNSAEQFYLGGPYGVRAYPVAQGNGSQGALGTIEYQQSLPYETTGIVFADAGVVQQYVNTYANWQGQTNANNVYGLYGTGFGLKWHYRGMALGATIAWKLGGNPLYNQQGQPVNVDGSTTSPRGWFTASYSF